VRAHKLELIDVRRAQDFMNRAGMRIIRLPLGELALAYPPRTDRTNSMGGTLLRMDSMRWSSTTRGTSGSAPRSGGGGKSPGSSKSTGGNGSGKRRLRQQSNRCLGDGGHDDRTCDCEGDPRVHERYPGCLARKRWGGGWAWRRSDIDACICAAACNSSEAPGREADALQVKRLEEWRKAGAVVAVVHSVGEVRAVLEENHFDHGQSGTIRRT
jgi:hypothetical protein